MVFSFLVPFAFDLEFFASGFFLEALVTMLLSVMSSDLVPPTLILSPSYMSSSCRVLSLLIPQLLRNT